MAHPDPNTAASVKGGSLAGLIRLARPKDWIKNVFVLIPVPFALADKTQEDVALDPLTLLLGLGGFCLVNSAVYTLNDLFDAQADRLHPRKQHRPIAAGQVSVKAAIVQSIVLAIAGVACCAATASLGALGLVATYIVINLAYSTGAKHVALLDVFLLASGFVIRVLLGCALVAALPSPWLLLCTSSLSLFLAFTKRKADLTAGLDASHRPSLRGYSTGFLDQAMTICAGLALVSYALYSIDSEVLKEGRQMASMPFVAFGILNYLRLAEVEGAGGSPVDMAFSSRASQICAIGWVIAVLWSLGLW